MRPEINCLEEVKFVKPGFKRLMGYVLVPTWRACFDGWNVDKYCLVTHTWMRWVPGTIPRNFRNWIVGRTLTTARENHRRGPGSRTARSSLSRPR